VLTLILLTWRIRWVPNNASKWQMGFNSAFKGLKEHYGKAVKKYELIDAGPWWVEMLVLVAQLHRHITLQLHSSFWITERLLIFTCHTPLTLPPLALLSSPNSDCPHKSAFTVDNRNSSSVTRELISIMKETYLAGVKNCVNMQISAWIWKECALEKNNGIF